MFRVRWTKAHNYRLNSLEHPNVKRVIDNLLCLNRSNSVGVYVQDVLNKDNFKVNDNNMELNDYDVKTT